MTNVAHLSGEDQYAVFVAASPDEQAEIYAARPAYYAERSRLTPRQRDALEQAATPVWPEWYALAHDAPG